jgi:uncharacterized protein YndB with AHSA1/START domain
MGTILAHTEMLIRKPVEEVFDAFVDPAKLESFWLTKASGPLAPGARVDWDFMVPGASEMVTVTSLVANEELSFTWSDELAITMLFQPHVGIGTRVTVTVSGFSGREVSAQAVDATEGFTIVLCDLKCLLETGHSGNMVRDKAALIASANF